MKTILPGQVVYWGERSAVVLELKGFADVIVRTLDKFQTEVVRVGELSLTLPSDQPAKSEHLLAADKDWEKAAARYELIRPLLEGSGKDLAEVQAVAVAAGKSVATIYRWINRFEETGLVSSLLRPTRSDKGEQRLDPEVEEIIAREIKDYYLKEERPSVIKLHRRIEVACHEVDLEAPHKNTVHARARELDRIEATRRRFGPKAAKAKYAPLRGKFPGADYPYAVVQIDHTPVDINLVDEKHRLPIGRPYLTIAIDVASKMLAGFLMTLDPPSALSAGLCISHAVLRKEHWLAKRDIAAEWPVYGKMRKIHLDNAKEFRGKMLERACDQHGIGIEHRPKGQPNYGPHVERAFRTFMQEVHSLPGTTFSNVQKKIDYDSEGRACMTLAELELWFTYFVVYCYHHRPHRGISDIAPIKMYHQFIFGNETQPGIGLPAAIVDEETFRLDFTPYEERTIQRHGVVIDHIHYYAPILRKWIAAPDQQYPSRTRRFIFARDPRDVSMVYFLDPDTNSYCPVPYLNNALPAISLWELRAIVKRLQDDKGDVISEQMIFEGIRHMRKIEEDAIEKTRLAKQQRATEKRKRRTAERRTGWAGVHSSSQKNGNAIVPQEDTMDDIVEPFSDIKVG
jgi:putative transposase